MKRFILTFLILLCASSLMGASSFKSTFYPTASGTTYNQSLNTGDSVTFDSITSTNNIDATDFNGAFSGNVNGTVSGTVSGIVNGTVTGTVNSTIAQIGTIAGPITFHKSNSTDEVFNIPSGLTVTSPATGDLFHNATGLYFQTANGTQSLDNNQIHYETLWIPAGAITPSTTRGATASTIEYTNNNPDFDVLSFNSTSPMRGFFTVTYDQSWDKTFFKAKFYWTNEDGASPADTVEWGIKAANISQGFPLDSGYGANQTISDALVTADSLHITSATAAFTGNGTLSDDNMVSYEVFRNVDGTDDMAEDAYLIGVLLQYRRSYEISGW